MTGAVIVNESFVKKVGWTDPIGKKLKFSYGEVKDPTVIGVVKDYHFLSLREDIPPLMLHLDPASPMGVIWVKIRPDDVPSTLVLLEETWRKIAPDIPFVHTFLEEANSWQYRAEARWREVIGYASLFAIFIACLGLFGLTSLAVTRRTKEIGVRKVLGASASNVVMLLSKDFVKLVLGANLIAWPVAYYAMNRWLQDFAYRINLGVGVFILGGLLALVIALLTVSAQAVKAARANPVDALRYE